MTQGPGDRFLSLRPGVDALARTPMHAPAREAGARFGARGGWELALGFGTSEQEAERSAGSVGFADASPAPKFELQATAPEVAALAAAVGVAADRGRAGLTPAGWWCPFGRTRLLLLGQPGDDPAATRGRLKDVAAEHAPSARIADLTTALASLTLAGPSACEAIARFCSLDLRPSSAPVGAFSPGSLARTPGAVLCEGRARYRLLFGWALGEYMWTVVADAAAGLGGGPVGLDALAHGDGEQARPAGLREAVRSA